MNFPASKGSHVLGAIHRLLGTLKRVARGCRLGVYFLEYLRGVRHESGQLSGGVEGHTT